MGRYYWSKKTEADGLRRISVFRLKEWGYLKPNQYLFSSISWTNNFSGDENSIGIKVNTHPSSPNINLNYIITRDNEEKVHFDYQIKLITTPCNFGGNRYWFICPLRHTKTNIWCNRKVATLYKAGDWFGCRNCYNLSYSSRNETRCGRLAHLFTPLMTMKKIDDQWKKIKRTHYAGKPTRKYKKLLQLEQQLVSRKFDYLAFEQGLLE